MDGLDRADTHMRATRSVGLLNLQTRRQSDALGIKAEAEAESCCLMTRSRHVSTNAIQYLGPAVSFNIGPSGATRTRQPGACQNRKLKPVRIHSV